MLTIEAIVLLTSCDLTVRNVLEVEQGATLESVLGVDDGVVQGLAAELDGPGLEGWDPALSGRKGGYEPAVARETSVSVPTWATYAQLVAEIISVEAAAAGLDEAG